MFTVETNPAGLSFIAGLDLRPRPCLISDCPLQWLSSYLHSRNISEVEMLSLSIEEATKYDSNGSIRLYVLYYGGCSG